MEKIVKICDTCKNKVANDKCDICNNDICDGCVKVKTYQNDFSDARERLRLFGICICRKCDDKHSELALKSTKYATPYSTEFHTLISHFKADFIKAMKKVLIADNLEKNG